MTEKEIYKKGVALLEEWEDVNYCEHSFKFKDEWLTDKEIVDKLNELNDENNELKKEIELGKRYCKDLETDLSNCADERIRLQKENKKLQERNNRQYQQLGNLYQLIEKQDWGSLNAIIEDLKKCEEQLQREWKCYDD